MNNFDFFVGTWTSIQSRRAKILADCDEWYDFPAETRCWSVLGGAGSVDEVIFPTQGFSGLTVRTFDPATENWSIYWASTRVGFALPPQVGRFDDEGVGRFLSDDVFEGRPVTVLYKWFDIQPDSCRWEQSFSVDGGETWEANWTAAFTRTG